MSSWTRMRKRTGTHNKKHLARDSRCGSPENIPVLPSASCISWSYHRPQTGTAADSPGSQRSTSLRLDGLATAKNKAETELSSFRQQSKQSAIRRVVMWEIMKITEKSSVLLKQTEAHRHNNDNEAFQTLLRWCYTLEYPAFEVPRILFTTYITPSHISHGASSQNSRFGIRSRPVRCNKKWLIKTPPSR